MYNKETGAPCGLYCGVYMSAVSGDEELRGKFAKANGVSPDEVVCCG